MEFQNLLSWQLWEDVFNSNDTNAKFNNFLNTYLRCYTACFEKINICNNYRFRNGWITKGIKASCKRKRELFLVSRSSNNFALKQYYKKYCLILTKIIRNAKRLHYNQMILRSKNKMKSTWQIINNELGINQHNRLISTQTLEGISTTDQFKITTLFNNYFSTVADSINIGKNKVITKGRINPMNYLHNFYTYPLTELN